MRFSRSLLTLVSLAQAFLLSECLHITSTDTDSLLLAEYDYVVVGGGASGLVIGNRLSEDPDGELFLHPSVHVLLKNNKN